MTQPISKYPVPKLEDLPEDIRTKMLEVQQKAGFIPNVFVTLAHRPDEFRAFFAYHDALMLQGIRAVESRKGNDRGRDQRQEPVPVLRDRPRRDPAHLCEKSADRRPGGDSPSQGRHHAAAESHAGFRLQTLAHAGSADRRRPRNPARLMASAPKTSGTSAASPRSSRSPTAWRT